jgi:CelD/BcsL family acetyltransferase involved in cellulose biosynthesis
MKVERSCEVRAVSQLDDLAALEGDWNRLLERHPRALPFVSYAWIASFFEHRLGPGERWVCVLAHQGGELVGVLPLVVRAPGRFPGTGRVASAPEDEHTFSVDPLIQPGLEASVAPALIRGALDAIPGCVRIDLPRLATDSPIIDLARDGGLGAWSVRSYADMGAYLPIEGDFASFRGSLSRNFRNNISKAGNKLAKSGQPQWIFKTGSEAQPGDLHEFLEVEASSWKGESGTAIARAPELIAFYTALTRRLAAAGWLQWQLLRLDGKLLAGNLSVVVGSRMLIWKLGYDESVSRMSPGTLLLEKVVARAFEQHGARGGEINLVTNYGWYDNWEMRRRRYETLQIYPLGLRAALLGYLPRLATETARQIPPLMSAIRSTKRFLTRQR